MGLLIVKLPQLRAYFFRRRALAAQTRHSMTAALCSLVLVLSGCATGIDLKRNLLERPTDWIMYGGQPARSNQSRSVLVPPLKPVWDYDAVSGIAGTPLVKDSVIVVGTLKGELHVIRLADGQSYGFATMESAVMGTPVVYGNYVYVPGAQGKETLTCLFLKDGKREWGSRLGPIETSPLMIGEFLYVTTLDGTLIAVKRADGGEFWKYETNAEKEQRKPIHSSPASDGEIIVFGSDDGAVYGVERISGRLRWKYQTGASVFATPVLHEETCIVGSLDSSLYAIDTRTGHLRWKFRTGSRIYSTASVSQGRAYVGGTDGKIMAVNLDSGRPDWVFDTRSVVTSAPLVSGDLLYIGSLDRSLYALRSATGEKIWEYSAEGRIRVSPVIWGDMLLLTYEDRNITALRPEKK
ncbi:MAG TPA: PQQ-binding-like beta-propeller repeat protein [Bacteroidota bacterium]|nr:PQQ-binding-like beta-propeller repeat protein [Bacteroidota bacterium]